MILGYTINTGAIMLLALTGRWEAAAVLLVAEQAGCATSFLSNVSMALLEMMLWRIGIGIQESIMKALIVALVPTDAG